MHRDGWFPVLAGAGVLATVALLWVTDVPLGVSGEWVWERIRYTDALGPWLSAGGVAIVGVAYLTFVAKGARSFGGSVGAANGSGTSSSSGFIGDAGAQKGEPEPTPGRVGTGTFVRAAWLSGLVAGGFVWLLAVQALPPVPYGLSKASHVLYAPGSSGYFFEARYGDWSTTEFLATYEERMRGGDVLHVGTHPPGLFLLYRAVLKLYGSSPQLAEIVAGTRPAAVREVDAKLLPAVVGLQPTTADVATLWTVTLLTHLVAVLTCVPLYLLVRRTASPRSAWWAAAFWPLVPGLAIFLPKSDALYPFIGMLFLWLWLEGVRRCAWWWVVAAGLVLWVGLWFSLALLPVGLLAVIVAAGETWCDASRPWRGLIVAGAIAFGVMAVATLATWLSCDLNLPAVWGLNLRNHAGFYERYPRTFGAWLFVNPLEWAISLGWPVALLGGAAVVRAMRGPDSSEKPGIDERAGRVAVLGTLAVWAVLWLSGKNMGEAARLWLFLAPWPLWAAFAGPGIGSDRGSETYRGMGWMLATQMVVCAATVARVNGFALPG